MQPVFAYLLKMILCSGILLGYYWLALRNERFHRWNRFYLLGSMVLSICVPFLNIPLVAPEEPSSVVFMVSELPWNKVNHPSAFEWSWKFTFCIMAILVSVTMLVRLIVSVVKVVTLYNRQPATRLQDVSLLLTEEESAPFSFFQWLFWRKDIDPDTESGKRMLQHELTHIHEKHSADKLFTEMLIIVFWMNPLFWIMRRELYAIHEFLADQKAIARNDGAAFAAMILLASHTSVSPSLSNPFFTSQLKRRLLMITTSKSNSHSYMRRISGLVLMLVTTSLLVLNIEQAQAQKKKIPPPPPPAAPSAEQVKELPDSIKNVEVIERNGTSYITYEMKDGRRLVYDLKQAKEKNYFIPPPPPPAPALPPAPHVKASVAPAPVKAPASPNATAVPALPATPAPAKPAATPAPVAAPAAVSVPPTPPAKRQNAVVEVNSDKPLYILNGVEISEDQMNQLDPSSIDRVDVIKGEQATSVYGQPAKKGVVSISSKTPNQNQVNKVSVQTTNVNTGNVSGTAGVNIKSVNTVNGNANINITPLYVVNKEKVSVEIVNKIKVDAIVSVNVLKDQAAIKQYGEEGKNGVVEITTKKPAEAKQ